MIAILISGHVRSYTKTRNNIKENLIAPLEKAGFTCHIFSSIWNNSGFRELEWKGDADLASIAEDSTKIEYENDLRDEFVHKYYEARGSKFSFQYSGPETCGDCVSMWYKVWKSFNLIDDKYDIVFRIRPDIIFNDVFDVELLKQIKPSTVCMANWNGMFKEVSCEMMDHFAFGDFESMKIYCNVYSEVGNIIKRDDVPFTGEGFLCSHLNSNKINIVRVPILYGLLRLHGIEQKSFG